MKLLIDVTSTQDQFANRGIGRYTHEIVAHMIAQSRRLHRDDTYFLITFNSPTTLEPVIQKYRDVIRTVNIGKLRLSDKFNAVWWSRQYLPAIKQVLAEQKIDVYFCPYFWRGFPAKLLPSVVMIHDLSLPILKKYSSAPAYLDWMRKIQYHRSLKKVAKADGVLTNSLNTKIDLLKYLRIEESKVKPVYLGLSEHISRVVPDVDILMKYLPKDVISTGYILYYGGIEHHKNVVTLVKSYAKLVRMLKTKMREVTTGKKLKIPYLVLAGGDFTALDLRNSVLSEIRDVIDNLHLNDNVYFTGFFEDSDMSDLISAAKLFVHLSLYEGFGFAALEPMKCGVPVVASNSSCYPEILSKGAVLVNPMDDKAIADACFDLLINEKKYSECSELGINQAKKFTWNKAARETYNYLSEVVENGKLNSKAKARK